MPFQWEAGNFCRSQPLHQEAALSFQLQAHLISQIVSTEKCSKAQNYTREKKQKQKKPSIPTCANTNQNPSNIQNTDKVTKFI